MVLKLHEEWVEVVSLLLIVAGFIIAVFIRDPALSYLFIFLAGSLAARAYYLRRVQEPLLPTVLLILGFLLGYLLGAFWVSRIWALFFFLVGFGISYYLHVKKIIKIFKSKLYVK